MLLSHKMVRLHCHIIRHRRPGYFRTVDCLNGQGGAYQDRPTISRTDYRKETGKALHSKALHETHLKHFNTLNIWGYFSVRSRLGQRSQWPSFFSPTLVNPGLVAVGHRVCGGLWAAPRERWPSYSTQRWPAGACSGLGPSPAHRRGWRCAGES